MRRVYSIALALLFCFFLSGCTGILNRSYSSHEPHAQFSDGGKDSDVLQAESYQGLLSALLYLVGQGETSGVIRLYNYTGPAEQDLDAAYWDIMEKDPMGSYALDYITYELSRVMSYYEVELKTISYRRSLEQINAIVSVTGANAIPGELGKHFAEFNEEAVFRVSYFDPNLGVEDIKALVEEAYYEWPESALSHPEISVELYPKESQERQRIVEIRLGYPMARETLLEQAQGLSQKVERLLDTVVAATAFEQVQKILETKVTLSQNPEDSNAYQALVGGKANSEGYALAVKLLCDRVGLSCQIVRGEKDGEPHVWTMVAQAETWQHWDPGGGEWLQLGDEEMQARGYRWQGEYPSCPTVTEP